MTKKGGHTGAHRSSERGSQLHFLFFSVILQLNPLVLPNLKANYKLIAAKFPYFPNSHWVSRARQCRAAHAPRHAHQSSALTVTFSIFCVISPPKSAQKIVQFKAIYIWNYIHKLPHKDFFLSMAKIITALQPTIIIIQSWGKIFTCSVAQTDNCDYCTRSWDLRLKLRCSLHRHPILFWVTNIGYRTFYKQKRKTYYSTDWNILCSK